jgi:hypothetical protein
MCLKPFNAAGLALGVVESLVFTPLCGVLFACGCDWPWNDLDAHCNFHNAKSLESCPWCVSLLTGGLTFLVGVSGSWLVLGYARKSGVDTRFGLGLAISWFVLTAWVSAVLSAAWQGYSSGWVMFFLRSV